MAKSKNVLLRLSVEEHAQLRSAAQAKDMSMNDYVRYRALGATPVSSGAYGVLAERVETLDRAMRLAGLDNAIAEAQKALGREEK